MPVRLATWEDALVAHVLQSEQLGHVWGRSDCALDAADAVLAMTGVDLAAAFRGRYRSRLGARRALARHGASALDATLDQLLGPPIATGFARRGDLAWHEGSVGIVMGGFALFRVEGQPGRVRVPRADWQKAWAVG